MPTIRRKKKGKPKIVNSKSNISVVSDLSNPSENDSESFYVDDISIPDAIEEGSYLEENPSGHSRLKDKKKQKSKSSKKKKKSVVDSPGGASKKKKKAGSSQSKSPRRGKTDSYMIYDDSDDASDDDDEEEDDDSDDELLAENEALWDEVTELKRKLTVRGDSMEMTQLQMDLKRALNEATELKSEIDEYEEAVAEKDGLIKKLTEAVDCQLDKVEYIELKLQRAEDEFVNMEDEMADMEDEIENLRNGEGKTNVEVREQDLGDRENELLMREQELLDRERNLVDREEELEIEDEKLSDQKDDIRMRELQLEENKREMAEQQQMTAAGGYGSGFGGAGESTASSYGLEEKQNEINTLKKKLALKTGEVHELRGQLLSSGRDGPDTDIAFEAMKQENNILKRRISDAEAAERAWRGDQEEELRRLQAGFNTQLEGLYNENESLKRKVEMLTLEREEVRGSVPTDIHEQLNEKDEHAKRQQQEIAQVWQENDSLKEELANVLSRLKGSQAQVAETKSSANKKMKQKDDTIEFMQSEMMRITMEKQDIDKQLREKVREAQVLELAKGSAAQNEEAELMRVQAFNEQLKILDNLNRELENKMKQAQYDHKIALKEKDAKILETGEHNYDTQSHKDSGLHSKGKKASKKDHQSEKKKRKKKTKVEREIQILKTQKADLEKKLKVEANKATEIEEKKAGNAGGLGLFGRKILSAESLKPAGGLWSAFNKAQEAVNKFDLNRRDNIVPIKDISERHLDNEDPHFAPILTEQSIEDELRAIEIQTENYEAPKPNSSKNLEDELREIENEAEKYGRPIKSKKKRGNVGSHPQRAQSHQRVDMTGTISSASGESSEGSKSKDLPISKNNNNSVSDDGSKLNNSIAKLPSGINIATRLQELQASGMNVATRLQDLQAKRKEDTSDGD